MAACPLPVACPPREALAQRDPRLLVAVDNAVLAQACAFGDRDACHRRLLRSVHGEGLTTSISEAMDELYELCGGGHAESCHSLGQLLLVQEAAEDKSWGHAMLEENCDAGFAASCRLAGQLLTTRRHLDHIDPVRAAALLDKGCALGDVPSCAHLGFAYANGVGVARDEAKAVAVLAEPCLSHDHAVACDAYYPAKNALDADGQNPAAWRRHLDWLFFAGRDYVAAGPAYSFAVFRANDMEGTVIQSAALVRLHFFFFFGLELGYAFDPWSGGAADSPSIVDIVDEEPRRFVVGMWANPISTPLTLSHSSAGRATLTPLEPLVGLRSYMGAADGYVGLTLGNRFTYGWEQRHFSLRATFDAVYAIGLDYGADALLFTLGLTLGLPAL